jgi:hypothetical protein
MWLCPAYGFLQLGPLERGNMAQVSRSTLEYSVYSITVRS